ncbi:MAG TPA: hypothetical protein PKA00_11235 [Saprospiraceae bacterium]|nr:hypothetical protein [Saprospiraceae bacterium]HMQ83475.1 hypothetical protein [Saprospiraceae bacterium]
MTHRKGKNPLWPLTLDQLHQDCKEWLGLVGYWKYELQYLSKLSKHFLIQPLSEKQGSELRHLFNDLSCRLRPEIRSIEGWIYAFSRQLAQLFIEGGNGRPKNASEHRTLYRKIDTFRKELGKIKAQLYALLVDVLKAESNNSYHYRPIWTHRQYERLKNIG